MKRLCKHCTGSNCEYCEDGYVDVVVKLTVETPVSEVLDRITILQLKTERFQDTARIEAAQKHLDVLRGHRARLLAMMDSQTRERVLSFEAELAAHNKQLWELEDDIRVAIDRRMQLRVASIAEGIVKRNDLRAYLKKRIDEACNSGFRDVKEYAG